MERPAAKVFGIDARAAAEVPAGRGRLVRDLLTALAALPGDHRFELYARTREPSLELDDRFEWRLSGMPDPAWHVRAAIEASRRCDVFYSTNSYLTPWFLRVPALAMVCDMVAFQPGARAQRRAARIERATLPFAVRRARRLVCISEATQRDLVARFPAAAARSVAIPLAAAAIFKPDHDPAAVRAVRERHGLERPFVLAAGTLEPRKNLPRLVEAYAGLPAAVRDGHELVLVGPSGWEMDETLASVRARPGDVRLLGFVPDEELAILYSDCALFCYPSLYEGFGLPLLEAMQSGAACVTSNVSSMPEVTGEAARYADPVSTDEIRTALGELLADEGARTALRERALERARLFSWETTARRTLDELEAAAGP